MTMTNEQLMGKYLRLRSELDAAYAQPQWAEGKTGRIDRIAEELAELEQALAQRLGTAHATGNAAG